MWVREQANGKFKFAERYTDPYTEKHKTVYVTLTSNSARARNQAQKILSEKISKKLNEKRVSDLTFKQLYDEWFKYYKKYVKRTSWIKVPKMIPHIQKFITDDVLIKNIDENIVQSIIDEMYTFGDLSLNYTKQVKTTLSTMLTYAVDKKYIHENVALKVKVIPKQEDKLQKKKRMEEKYLEPEEFDALMIQLYSSKQNYIHALISEFLYLNGLRYGELLALQVKNNKGDYIEVHGTLDYTDVKMSEAKKTTPKNDGSWRNVEITERSKEILDIMYLENHSLHGDQTDDNYYFVSYHGTPLTIGSYNTAIKNAGAKIGIDKNLTSHIFRHTHVAVLSEMGIPLEAIMQRVGHMDAGTTLGIYNHVTSNMKEQLLSKLNELKSYASFMLLSDKKGLQTRKEP